VSAENTSARGVVFRPKQSRFLTIPQSPLSYWLRERFLELLSGAQIASMAIFTDGVAVRTRFLRLAWEVPNTKRWIPYAKGGEYERWAGGDRFAYDWEWDGSRIKTWVVSRYPADKLTLLVKNHDIGANWVSWSDVARGSIGARLVGPGYLIAHTGPAATSEKISLPSLAAILQSRAAATLLRGIAPTLHFTYRDVMRLPVPGTIQRDLDRLAKECVALKRLLIVLDPAERQFECVRSVALTLRETSIGRSDIKQAAASILHCLEAFCERSVFHSYGIADQDLASALDETGTPAGWYALVAGYDAIPPLPEGASVEAGLLAPLVGEPRAKLASDELANVERRLQSLYEAGPWAAPEADENADPSDDDGEESEEAVSGARIPIPAETFLEELSQKLEIHPISVYWLLRELREKDDVVCLPELRRFVSDHFSIMILRMLGHRWPRQVEAGEPIPEWADPAGIIAITEGTGRESLISRVRKRIAADFGTDRVSAIEREFEQIMSVSTSVSLETWLGRDFFRNHISQFRKRPIAWQLQSTPETSNGAGNGRGKRAKRKTRADRAPIFSCLIYYHRIDGQLLGTVRTQYAHPMRLRMETELRELERIDAKVRTPDQEDRRADLIVRVEELKDFEARLERVERDGFDSEALTRIASKEPLDKWTSPDGKKEHPRERDAFLAQEKRYDPDLNDGVRVNVVPLQKAGLLAADVLAAKDIDKAISDRADWRADERRWCRDGKLPRPGWWES